MSYVIRQPSLQAPDMLRKLIQVCLLPGVESGWWLISFSVPLSFLTSKQAILPPGFCWLLIRCRFPLWSTGTGCWISVHMGWAAWCSRWCSARRCSWLPPAVSGKSCGDLTVVGSLTQSQPGGGGGAQCAPRCAPRYTFSNISRTPWATDLKLSDNLNELILQTKSLFFNCFRPALVTIAKSKVDACFWKTHFGSFHEKLTGTRTRRFFLLFPWRVTLIIMYIVVEIWAWYSAWWRSCDNFCFTLFSMLHDLKLATRIMSFNFIF